VGLQPLYLLNSQFSVERAHALAERVRKSAGTDQAKQISAVYRIALGREPDARERTAAAQFFERLASSPDAALERYCQAIMNLNEFVYIE
jgi:hypothetical protein